MGNMIVINTLQAESLQTDHSNKLFSCSRQQGNFDLNSIKHAEFREWNDKLKNLFLRTHTKNNAKIPEYPNIKQSLVSCPLRERKDG